MTNNCMVCGEWAAKDPSVSFHRFPSDVNRRRTWLSVYDLTEDQWKPYWRICSRHFPEGDARLAPEIQRGKRATSQSAQPIKRAPVRQATSDFSVRHSHRSSAKRTAAELTVSTRSPPALIADVAEPLEKTHCLGQELSLPEPAPTDDGDAANVVSGEATPTSSSACNLGVMVHTALLAQVKALDSENHLLKQQVAPVPSFTARVVDITSGGPAQGVLVELSRWDTDSRSWSMLGSGVTMSDGKCINLLAAPELGPGTYRLYFDTERYFTAQSNLQHFYPYVEVVFCLQQSSKRQHFSLMLSPSSYSVYTES